MTCRELASFLVEYLDGTLPVVTRRTFDEHLSLCPNCVRYLEQYKGAIAVGRAAVTQLEAAVATDFPDDLRKAILAARQSS